MWKAGVIAALVGISASSAQAQAPQCAPRGVVIENLADRFGEARQSQGMASQGVIAEMFANPSTGTWTFTITGPDGITCLMMHGENFEALDEAPMGTTF